MQKRTHGILSELDELLTHRDRNSALESRANNIIMGAINLIRYIHENYQPEHAGELERRLLNAIKGQDPAKFMRGIRKIKDEDQ